jgi:hypothetical protein
MYRFEKILADMPMRCAVAELIGYCEGICDKDLLGEELEAQFRKRIEKASRELWPKGDA